MAMDISELNLDEPTGHECLCRASGKLITRKIQLLVGDRVTVELSPYDLTRGRITLRENEPGTHRIDKRAEYL